MGLVIDGFAHVMPKRFAEKLSRAYPTIELKELANLEYFDIDNRMRILDRHKIDKQVLTLARPGIWLNMPRDLLPEFTRMANDMVAEAANRFPDRFIPVAHLAVPTEEYLPEFDRCINLLGMAGIHIASNIDGKPLDAPEFRSFWAKANSTKTPVWIHPQLEEGWSERYTMDKIFGWIFETSTALSRLVFSGIMEEFSDLRVIAHHMGAMVPHFCERIKAFYNERSMYPRAGFTELRKDPLDYFRCFYGDTVLSGALHAFKCGYTFFGPEHIIFATDYPFGPRQGEGQIENALSLMKRTRLGQAEKEMILEGNMMRLIGRR